jgi:hypothetical protein
VPLCNYPGHTKRQKVMNAIPGRGVGPAVGVFLALLAACSGGDRDHPAAGTLTGHLFLVGGPAPGKPRPLTGTIIVNGPGRSRLTATDTTGSFTIRLPTGRYSLTGRSALYDDGNTECQPPTRVTVRSGRIQKADVYCQAA